VAGAWSLQAVKLRIRLFELIWRKEMPGNDIGAYAFSGTLLSEEILAKLMFKGLLSPEDITELIDETLLIIERAMTKSGKSPELLLEVQSNLENLLAAFARPQD
jgi:hypothetical protein